MISPTYSHTNDSLGIGAIVTTPQPFSLLILRASNLDLHPCCTTRVGQQASPAFEQLHLLLHSKMGTEWHSFSSSSSPCSSTFFSSFSPSSSSESFSFF